MFDPFKSHDEMAAKIAALQPMRHGNTAKPYELENNAGYIEQLCKLVADHVEAVMADADASQSDFKIDETLAHTIVDVGSDCAGALNEAAWAMECVS